MKVNMTLDVTPYERYVIAKFFAPAGTGADRTRARATREQVRRFTRAAVRTWVKDQAREFANRRARATAQRLEQYGERTAETLPPLREQQRSLQW